MLRRIILAIIVLGAVGLVVGYLVFARKSDGGYLSLKSLISPAKNVLDDLVKNVRGIPQIRQSILICGAVGGGIGLLAGALTGGGRRRRR
jgi:hypothetical protein